ncbi:MAG: methyltransferase [Bacteroidota bacterium]
MQFLNLREVEYEGRHYQLNSDDLGGTPAVAALRGSDELLLNWLKAQRAAAPELQSLAVNVFEDHSAILSLLIGGKCNSLTTDSATATKLQLCWQQNGMTAPPPHCQSVLHPWSGVPLNLMRLPKSLDLFELLLGAIAARAQENTQLAVSFMTRHFSPRILEIAQRYADRVEQSRAYKKARLLLISSFKSSFVLPQVFPRNGPQSILPNFSALMESSQGENAYYHDLSYGGHRYHQLYGVFSAQHIDYGTQFLLDSWASLPRLADMPPPQRILDMGCGNGVIGHQLLLRYPEARLEAFDSSFLAVYSAQYNLTQLVADQNWEVFPASSIPADRGQYDLIISNPPFHDGHRNTIDPSLQLFRQAATHLKADGSLVLVANRHLNYSTHLSKLFTKVAELATNKKYVLYRCQEAKQIA